MCCLIFLRRKGDLEGLPKALNKSCRVRDVSFSNSKCSHVIIPHQKQEESQSHHKFPEGPRERRQWHCILLPHPAMALQKLLRYVQQQLPFWLPPNPQTVQIVHLQFKFWYENLFLQVLLHQSFIASSSPYRSQKAKNHIVKDTEMYQYLVHNIPTQWA